MVTWLLLAASAAVSTPVAVRPKGSPAHWFRAKDLPKLDQKAGLTTFDLTIDRSGLPSTCSIVVPSGSENLDTAVCKTLLKRARFKPSMDADGNTTASVYRERVAWLPQETGENYWFKTADIVISTPDLLGQLKKIAEVVVVTDADGITRKCFTSKSVGVEKLDKLACSVAIDPKISSTVMIQGEPVRGVRLLRFGFEEGAAMRVLIR